MLSVLSFLLTAAAPASAITPKPLIELRGPEIRVSDVLAPGALRTAAATEIGERIIARIPPGRERITLSRAILAALVRRRIPALDPAAGDGDVAFIVHSLTDVSPSDCAAVAHPIAAGQVISQTDLRPVACSAGGRAGKVSLDRSTGILRAAEALDAGTYLGRLRPASLPPVWPGSEMVLISRVGPVQIERKVTALQPGSEGKHIFVRDEDGEVVSVAFSKEPMGDRR